MRDNSKRLDGSTLLTWAKEKSTAYDVNQQYQSTEGTQNNTQITEKYNNHTHIM